MSEHPQIIAEATNRLAAALNDLKDCFVGKDEIIDLLGIGLVARENVFLLGPPGTAKSALVHALAQRIGGKSFDYLLTRFTEPNELFGPFDIRRLREGDLVTNTEGMLPEASLVFLDELLNANSAILNSLLMVLNERVFRRGRETCKLPTLMVVGASNLLPEDAALGALFDRFLLRVTCDNVAEEQLADVLDSGWRLERRAKPADQAMIALPEVEALQAAAITVSLDEVRPKYLEVVHRLRQAGIAVSDRRAVKLQRVIAASALVCGRSSARSSDLWVLRHVWDRVEQREVIVSVVNAIIGKTPTIETDHPRSRADNRPDPESLARELAAVGRQADDAPDDRDCCFLRDRIALLSARIEWVENPLQREALTEQVEALWRKVGVAAP